MAVSSGYSTAAPINGGSGTSPAVDGSAPTGQYWTLQQCKQAYLDYTGSKSLEIEEIKEARRYRHHSQWTADQIRALNNRKQPVVTYPRIGRKIDGIVGTVERIKQDPKAYPRTPQQEQGADLATAALRYALESQQWEQKTPIAADNCATDGHSGIELELIEGDRGDREIGFNLVEDGYFYDPRSFRLDFSDARYQGVSKLVDIDTAVEMMPDHEEELRNSVEMGGELATNSDRENRWFTTIGKRKFIRLVDLWYKHKGGWCYAIFTGAMIMMEGPSFFFDEKKKPISKYLMFRCAVDQDGDSYGFVRALKSSQDEINQRRSKGLHILNTRRIIAERGAFDDVEKARQEGSRPDGVVEHNPGYKAEFDDAAKQIDLAGQVKFLEDAKAEIDNYGPSQVVTGEGVDNQSGRAIALRQNAAMAELGPFLLSYKAWKLRCYRAIFSAIQKHWTGERWIRVTDSEGLAQFIKINGTEMDPMTGQPVLVNAMGSVDVDIILDEGPDTINAMADTFETLKEIVPSVAPLMPPPKVSALIDVLIATSPLPSEIKQKFAEVDQQMKAQPPQPTPEQVEMQKAQAQLQLEAQKAQQQAALKKQDQEQTLQLEAYKTQQEINLEREKAAAQLEIARQKAECDMMLAEHKANHDAHVQAFKADKDNERADKQFKFDRNMDRKKNEGETVNDDGDVAVESPLAKSLEHIAEMTAETLKIAADTNKVARAPRRSKIIKGKDGRPAEAVSTVDVD